MAGGRFGPFGAPMQAAQSWRAPMQSASPFGMMVPQMSGALNPATMPGMQQQQQAPAMPMAPSPQVQAQQASAPLVPQPWYAQPPYVATPGSPEAERASQEMQAYWNSMNSLINYGSFGP